MVNFTTGGFHRHSGIRCLDIGHFGRKQDFIFRGVPVVKNLQKPLTIEERDGISKSRYFIQGRGGQLCVLISACT